MITLYLVSNRLLKKPSLYLSDYIEKHKDVYYESLTRVRTQNDLNGWIKFFLEAVIVTASNGIQTFESILKLKQEMDVQIQTFGKKAHNASRLMEYLYQQPITTIGEVAQILDVTKTTASSLIGEFEAKMILHEITGSQRNKQYSFKKYIDIYKNT
jgi:Fic family protein